MQILPVLVFFLFSAKTELDVPIYYSHSRIQHYITWKMLIAVHQTKQNQIKHNNKLVV